MTQEEIKALLFCCFVIAVLALVKHLMKPKLKDVDDFVIVDLSRFKNTPACRCDCGYTCGGPGRCDLEMMECIEKHYKRDCDHKFDGPLVPSGRLSSSQLCQVCGVSAMSHDCMVGP